MSGLTGEGQLSSFGKSPVALGVVASIVDVLVLDLDRAAIGACQVTHPARGLAAVGKLRRPVIPRYTFNVAAGLNFVSDNFRDVLQPVLQRVECHDADWVVELP